MQTLSRALLSTLLLGSAAACDARDEPAELDTHVHQADTEDRLVTHAKETPSETTMRFLRARGIDTESLALVSARTGRGGVEHLRFEQRVGHLRVHGAEVRSAVSARGDLLQVIDRSVSVSKARSNDARIDEAGALQVVLAKLHPELKSVPRTVGREDGSLLFSDEAFFREGPRVERVLIPMESGALAVGFVVETWTVRGNQLRETLVGGDGRLHGAISRTASDSYNVFTENPNVTPQTVVSGPAPGGTESPAGWLGTGTQTTVDITGNNAHAYLDTDANNAPDSGGTAVSGGNFLASADLTAAPSTSGNQAVAVQNLFYLNNRIHDELYRHGFDEAAGNFQTNNFGRRGRDNDPVNAEAQDGSGTDNANFATPKDGRSPRMQMYLWTGKGTAQVVVDAPSSIAGTYTGEGAGFGPALTQSGLTGDIVLVDDGTGTTSDGCEAISGAVAGKIALIDRGTCAFTVKVKNAQLAGAVAAIVANNAAGSAFAMGGTDATITIPSAMVTQADGATLRSAAGVHGTVRASVPAPLMIDGDVDSDIVFHEYCHGLTWRMIGSMSGPMSGAIGEGMSDVCAVIMNGDDVMGEYAFSDPLGIRTAPYHNFPRTYGSVTGSEVHFDGEIYGAIGWRLYELYGAAGLSASVLLDDIVDGMNYTPAGPTYEQMRDGILASISANGLSSHTCLVWNAFAQYGVGVGARGRVHGGAVTVTESFAKPSTCP